MTPECGVQCFVLVLKVAGRPWSWQNAEQRLWWEKREEERAESCELS
jgi:hypothetical protein